MWGGSGWALVLSETIKTKCGTEGFGDRRSEFHSLGQTLLSRGNQSWNGECPVR